MANLKSLLLLCLLPLQALAAPAPADPVNESPIPGYGIEELQWEVEVFPGQGLLNFTGTIEKVHHEILALNPNWKAPGSGPTKIQKRYDRWTNLICNARSGEWRPAGRNNAWNGIQYLRGVKGPNPRNGPGPGNCGRVSCSYAAAIFWCNDNRQTHELSSWNDIADGAEYIHRKCATDINVLGQVFAQDNWNVIIRAQSCN